MKQPPVFESIDFPDHVMKLGKAFCGLKQVSRAWYERLSRFLLSHGYKRGKIDKYSIFKN